MNKQKKTTNLELVKSETSIEALISQAINTKVDVTVMEKLLVMRRELKAEWAREQYQQALAAFQADLPVIKKTKTVMNKDGKTVRYKYAPLDSIVAQVKGNLEKHGFSHREDGAIEGKFVTGRCIATHRYGHSEMSAFAVPIDPDAYMNDAQKYASALTFAKRYAFCNTFGILTGDADTDTIEIAAHDQRKKHTPLREYERETAATSDNAGASKDLDAIKTFLSQQKIPDEFMLSQLRQRRFIAEDVDTVEKIQPGILRKLNDDKVRANLLTAWKKSREETKSTGQKQAKAESVRTNEGDQSSTNLVRMPIFEAVAPADLLEQSGYTNWRKVKIHFGESLHKTLGSLSQKVLHGWITCWKPEPYRGTWNEADLLLDAALCLASQEMEGG